jgi:hypothetical protein
VVFLIRSNIEFALFIYEGKEVTGGREGEKKRKKSITREKRQRREIHPNF